MKKITAVVVAVGLACLLSSSGWAQTAAAKPDLASADWSLTQAQVLNAESNAAVWNFMNGGASGTDNPENGKVCKFHFVNLRDSGKLSLVICYDGGGTVDCDLVAIIDRTPAGFEYYDFDPSLSFDSVQDLSDNGRYELIVRAGLAGGGTNHCTATWPVVYAWTGNGYSDLSSQYKNYYEHHLEELQKQIADSSGTEDAQAPAAGRTPESAPAVASVPPVVKGTFSSSSNGVSMGPFVVPVPAAASSMAAAAASIPDLADVDCTKTEAAKIERFLGISRDAGMSDAIKWANSDDPNKREFAADVLSEIGTPEAIEYLKTLSHDPDPNVAAAGGGGLLAVNTPEEYPTIKAEPLAKPVPVRKQTKFHHTHAAIGQPVAPLNAPVPN
ncbi:MAG: HEAT repeat domain-containing protein [Candidatus Binatus sp.]|jgi:hypothetical protein